MTETARADDTGPITSDVIPGIGTTLAGITMVAMLVPVRQGVDDLAVWAGVGFALAAVLAFLVRRHGGIERTIAGPIAAGSSVAVVLLAGYALNQGITASTSLPSVSLSIPLVFVAFVTAGLTAGVGVAESLGIGLVGFKRRTQQLAVLTGVGFAGLFAPEVTTPVLTIPIIPFVESLSETELLVVSQVVGNLGMALGTAIIAVGYLRLTDRDRSFLDLRLPTAREVGWTVAGLIVLFGAVFAIDFVMQTVGVEGSDHATTQQAQERPELMLVMIPIAILVIGPFEELLYRNVIQKSLYDTFSRAGAVVTASVIFAAVHVSAYATAGLGAVIASLGTVFGLSLVLGTLYERTENLVIPALVHGLYNALLFANLYSLYG